MNARERYLNAVNGLTTDRVPVPLFIVEQGHFMTQLHPNTDLYDHETQISQLIDFEREIGADVSVRLLADLYEPALHVVYGGVNTTSGENWDVHSETVINGNTTITRSTIKTPMGTLTQDFSVNELRPGTLMYACTKSPVSCEQDLDIVMAYEPPMDANYPNIVAKAFERTRAQMGEDGILSAWVPYGPFNTASLLLDLSEIYVLYLTDPDYYAKLMHYCIQRNKPYCQAILDAKPDVVHVGGNVPGGFLGKTNYDQHILKYEREYITFCQKEGIPAMYHNCGEIMNLIESYKDLSIKIVEPFSPQPLGDAELEKALKVIDGAYAVVAGVDQVNVLQNGTTQDVVNATEKVLQTGKTSGKNKFIIQNADFLEYGTPVENIKTFVETAKKLGEY